MSVTDPPSQNVVGPDSVTIGDSGFGAMVTGISFEIVIDPQFGVTCATT